jgi:type IV pilus assembly protein PilC
MLFRSFTLKDKIFFLKELAYLLNGWVSIPIALETIATNTENDTIRKICEQIYVMIKRWETLSRSLSVLDEYFTEWDVNIISSWEAIWELPRILNELANEYEQLYLIKTKYISAMIYPSVLVFIIIIAFVVIFKFILPWFISIISSFQGVDFPTTTKILIYMNNFFSNYGWLLMILLLFVLIIISLFLSTEDGRLFLSSLLIKLPLVGKIFRLYYVVYFLRYFSLLIYSGLPIIKVFLYLRWVMTNPFYKQMCDDILVALNRWESFIPVMKKYTNILPSDVIVLLKVGEETANLQQAAKNAILLYEEEFNKIVDNLSKIVEPILIVIVGWVIWFVAISIFSVVMSVLDSIKM